MRLALLVLKRFGFYLLSISAQTMAWLWQDPAILTNFVSWFVGLIITLPNQPSLKQNIHVSLGLTFANNVIS